MTMLYNISLPMVIRKIEICNFRIFYKDNAFELLDGLNLILGWHGDGKTTFFDALDWLFRTDGTNKMDTKYISKKRIEELFSGDSDNVRVAMTYEHKGKVKVLEKAFRFTKSFDDEVGTTNYTFTLTEQNGEIKVVVQDVVRQNYLFGLILFFFASIVLVGKKKGVKAIIGLIITLFAIFFVLITSIFKGYNPILVSIGTCFLITILTFTVIGG